MIERLAHQGGAIKYLPNVVHPDVPLVSGSMENVRVAADFVVPFQNQDFFARVNGEQGSRGHSADARTHDDGIPPFIQNLLLVGKRFHVHPANAAAGTSTYKYDAIARPCQRCKQNDTLVP